MHSSKKLLTAVLGLILCMALLSAAVILPYFKCQDYDYEDAAVRDSLAGSVDTIASGASQAYVAFNPEVYDAAVGTNSYNLSGSRMTMLARSTLLHQEIARNPVKTVYLELSFDTMTRDRDTETPEGDIYALPRMGGLRETWDFFRAAFRPKEYCQLYADTLYRGFRTLDARLHGDEPMVSPSYRGLHIREAADMSMSPEEFAQIHNTSEISENLQTTNERLFVEMIEDCQAQGIEVVIFTTPVTDRILARFKNFDVMHGWYQSYADAHGCAYLDFNLYKQREELLPNDTAFADDNHLSREGAAAFTAELAALQGRLAAGEDVSDLFYDSYAQMDAAMSEFYAAP